MREKYLNFIAHLGGLLRIAYNRFWWYSLVHEKNTIISNTYNNLLNSKLEIKVGYFDAIFLAIEKYFTFVFRYLYFFRFVNIKEEELLFTYYGNFFNSLKTDNNKYVYIPQKNDYKKVREEKDSYVIDNFISVADFIYVLFKYVIYVFTFDEKYIRECFRISAEVNGLSKHTYIRSRDDVCRSFIGDVMVEGLFYDRIFKRINRKIKRYKVKRVIYVFEGRSWEKALCHHIKKEVIKIGIICSAVSKNNLQFFYTPLELSMMPFPEYIGVPGKILKEVFDPIYDAPSVFVIGSDRYAFPTINDYKEKRKILVVLGANDEQNAKLLDFIGKSIGGSIYVKIHPSSNLDKDFIMFRWYNFKIEDKLDLSDKKVVIAVSSGVCIEALAYGIPTIIPTLDFIDFIPIDDNYKGQQFCYRVKNAEDLMIALDKVESIQLDYGVCSEYVRNYFEFKTKQEKRKIIEELK